MVHWCRPGFNQFLLCSCVELLDSSSSEGAWERRARGRRALSPGGVSRAGQLGMERPTLNQSDVYSEES